MDRNSIINLHKKGLKNTKIAKALRINRSKVWKTLKHFGERGDAADRLTSGRPRMAHMKKRSKPWQKKFKDA